MSYPHKNILYKEPVVKKHRFSVSFILTLFLYVTVASVFVFFTKKLVGTEQKPKEKTISFSLSQYTQETIVEEPIKETPKEPEDKPVVKEVEPELTPEPIVEKLIAKPLPLVKKKKILKKKHIKKTVRKKVVKKKSKKIRPKKRTKHKVRKASKQASKSQASPAKKNAFLAKVRAKINRAKSYPRIAQRRGMQGSVKVRFTILKNGHVSNIQVSGKKVFFKSARQAVKKAFPISVKHTPLSLPSTVNLTLRYQLR